MTVCVSVWWSQAPHRWSVTPQQMSSDAVGHHSCFNCCQKASARYYTIFFIRSVHHEWPRSKPHPSPPPVEADRFYVLHMFGSLHDLLSLEQELAVGSEPESRKQRKRVVNDHFLVRYSLRVCLPLQHLPARYSVIDTVVVDERGGRWIFLAGSRGVLYS